MNLALLLILIGVVIAVLVHWTLGLVLIVVGLCLLIFPYLSSSR